MSVTFQPYLDILQNSHVQQILVKKIIEKLKAHIDDDTRFYLITEKSLNLSLFKDDKKTWKSLLIDKSGSTRGSASPSGTLQPAPAPAPPPAAGPDSLSNTGTKALQDWYLINALQANSSTQRTDNIIEFIKLMSEYNGNPFEEILIIRDATYSVTDSSSSLLYQITNTLRNDTDFNNIFSELIRKLKTLHNYPNLQMFRVQLKKIIDGNASNHSNLVWQFIRILYWKINNTPGALSSWHKLSRNKLPGLYHIRSEYFKVGVRAPPPTMSPTGSPTDNMNDKLNSVATNIKNDDLPSAQSVVQRLISSRPTGLGNAANRIRNLLDGILRIIRGAISSGDSKLPPPQRESVSKNIKEIKTININNSNNNKLFGDMIIDAKTPTQLEKSERLEALRKRLEKKIQDSRERRKASEHEKKAMSAKNWREEREKSKLEKKEREKRMKKIVDAKKRNNNNTNDAQTKPGGDKQQRADNNNTTRDNDNDNDDNNNNNKKFPKMNLSFGNVDVDEAIRFGGKNGKKKKETKKDLLSKALRREKDLADAGGDTTKEGKRVAEKHAWEASLKRARGEKVLDDPKLLRKSVKREEKKKQK